MARAMKRATIKQVATEAGVSPTTVSHLLSGKLNACSPETAERIREVVLRLGYEANASAKSMRTQSTGMIGICAIDPFTKPYGQISEDDLRHGFMERLWRGINHEADSASTPLIWYPNAIRTGVTTGPFLDGSADGILYLSNHEDSRPERLAEAGLPIVLVARSINVPDTITTYHTDESEVVDLALSHLWALGHRRIAHIASPVRPFPEYEPILLEQSDIALSRLHHYTEWMRHRNAFDEDLIGYGGGWHGVRSVESVFSWKRMRKPPTAVFCANDAIAIKVIEAAESAGMRVPRDLSVVGVDNTARAPLASTPLTTIDVAAEVLGAEAFRDLIGRVKNPGLPTVHQAMRISSLVVRSSAIPPKT